MPKKTDKSDDNKRNTSDTARRIWLAGIGAYGRAFTEAQGAIKEVTGKSSAVFDDLVQKGQMFEAVGKAKGKEIAQKAQVPDMDIDARIKSMREKIKAASAKSSDWVEDHIPSGRAKPASKSDVEARLDAMDAKLDAIMAAIGASVAKPKAKRAPAKKTSARKTAANKPAAKKPPLKKSSTKKVTTKRTPASKAKKS